MTAHMLSLNTGKLSPVSAESLHETSPSMKEAASLLTYEKIIPLELWFIETSLRPSFLKSFK